MAAVNMSYYFVLEFRIPLRFRPKLSLDIPFKVRLRPYKRLWFRPRFQLRLKLAKSVSVGLCTVRVIGLVLVRGNRVRVMVRVRDAYL